MSVVSAPPGALFKSSPPSGTKTSGAIYKKRLLPQVNGKSLALSYIFRGHCPVLTKYVTHKSFIYASYSLFNRLKYRIPDLRCQC